MILHFFMPGVPPKTTFQAKKIMRTKDGRQFVGKTKEAAESAATLASMLAPHRPDKPLAGQVWMAVVVTWPYRKSDLSTKAKRDQAATRSVPHTVKPDIDNFAKGLLDCMAQMLFIENDQCVYDLHLTKRFGMSPGIEIMAGDPS